MFVPEQCPIHKDPLTCAGCPITACVYILYVHEAPLPSSLSAGFPGDTEAENVISRTLQAHDRQPDHISLGSRGQYVATSTWLRSALYSCFIELRGCRIQAKARCCLLKHLCQLCHLGKLFPQITRNKEVISSVVSALQIPWQICKIFIQQTFTEHLH